ncbi:hypothetical protein STEG23_002842 [Scotinomys teguina]
MTKQKKKHDGRDAHVHSRLPLVKRKEEVEEQDDWHHTQLRDLLREDIKETVREQLAIEQARMKELLRKHQEEIRRQVKNDLRHIFMENMALLQEQVKETQQELWNLHYPQQEDLFREDLKEMVCEEIKNSKIIMCPKEEPLPEASKGTADFQRTPRKQKRKKEYEGDHHSAPSHSENPSVQIEDEIIDALSVSDCMSLMEAIEKDVQKAVSEIFEKYKHYICMKKEQPHSLRRRQDKEMKPWKTYGTPISSVEHKIAALHVQPALAVYLGNFDDEGDMEQVAEAEWAHPVDSASSIEHQRWH